MNRNFNDWLSKFKASISNYSYYVDFDKIYGNVDKVKVELNILNSLIGSKNIEEEFQNILIKYRICKISAYGIVSPIIDTIIFNM